MFRPQIQKTYILVIMALFNLLMVKLALHKEEKKLNNYDEMVMAASFMEEAINELQNYKDKDLGIIIDYDFIEVKSFGYKVIGCSLTNATHAD